MGDKNYDVVFVGGGNKALVASMYLTKYGGLKVGLFEARHELGTGWSSEEPAGGYLGNTCSNAHMGWYQSVLYRDFPEFADYGARYAYTSTVVGTVFEDQSCILQYAAFPDVDPDQTRTAALFAQYSEKDAQTWLYLWEKARNYWLPAMLEWMHNPAKPSREPDAMDRLFMNPDAGIDPHWLMMNPVQLFTSLFEEPRIQIYAHRVTQSWGIAADEPGAGWPALLAELTWVPFAVYVVGGTHALTHAAFRVIAENGGEAKTSSKVDKILIENGKATGIRLADGTEVSAKIVVTDVDPYQLVFNLIGPEKLDPVICRKVSTISRDWITIMWFSWAFTERPKFLCEDKVPDAGYCQGLNFGATSKFEREAFYRESAQRRARIWPTEMNALYMYQGYSPTTTDCQYDQCVGPANPAEGNFKVLTEQFVLPNFALSEEEWKMRERKHTEEMLAEMKKYAPNVGWDIVSGYVPVTPHYTAGLARNYAPAGNWAVIDNTPMQIGKFRPIPELAANRVPGIKGLYCTGTAWHPFAIANSAQGYNCYKSIAEDLNLKKPWEGYVY
jgi:phytoene dehydrogenase-like protein